MNPVDTGESGRLFPRLPCLGRFRQRAEKIVRYVRLRLRRDRFNLEGDILNVVRPRRGRIALASGRAL